MACEGFGRREGWHLLAEEAAQGSAFGEVVIAGAGAVGVYVVHFVGRDTGTLESLLHGAIRTFAVVGSGRLMEGVAGVAVAGQSCEGFGPTTLGVFALAEVEACTACIERTARLVVENHQRREAVEVELGDTFAATNHNTVGVTGTDELGASDDGVGGRRAGCRQGCQHLEATEVVGYHLGASTAVVGAYVLVAAVVLKEVKVI